MVNPKLWGNHGWTLIHYITVAYPDNPTKNDADNMKQFFYSLSNVLPCASCRFNFEKHLKDDPLSDDVLSSRGKLMEWGFRVHNAVNLSLGKRVFEREKFMSKYYGRRVDYFSVGVTILIMLVMLISLYFIYHI